MRIPTTVLAAAAGPLADVPTSAPSTDGFGALLAAMMAGTLRQSVLPVDGLPTGGPADTTADTTADSTADTAVDTAETADIAGDTSDDTSADLTGAPTAPPAGWPLVALLVPLVPLVPPSIQIAPLAPASTEASQTGAGHPGLAVQPSTIEPATQPSGMRLPVTQPPATQPPATQPPSTRPPVAATAPSSAPQDAPEVPSVPAAPAAPPAPLAALTALPAGVAERSEGSAPTTSPAPTDSAATNMTVRPQGGGQHHGGSLADSGPDGRREERGTGRPGVRLEPGAGPPVSVSYEATGSSTSPTPSQAPTTTEPTVPSATAVSATQATVPAAQTALVAAPTAPTAPTAPSTVAHQVYDRIDRLASFGNGTHRVTMRLDPGTLGEVRVMLTVQGGQVRVRLAAGDEARLALSHAAPDLQRLLQTHGASEVRIDVTGLSQLDAQPSDRPSDQPTDPQQGQPHDLSETPMGSEDAGSRTGQHDAPARTHGANTATEGDKDRVDRPGSVEPRKSTPVSGVDVRM